MAAPIKFLSGRNQQQKIGIEGSTENQKVLEVVGRVGIGTTIFEPTSELEVRGDIKISGILTAGNIDVSTGQVNFSQLNVTGVSTFASAADFNGSIDVDGHTELDDVNVSGAITATTFTGNLAGTVNTASQPNITSLGTLTGLDVNGHSELDNVNVSGVSTFVGVGTFKNDLYVSDNVYIAGFVTATRLYSSVFGEFTGSSVSADNIVGSALSISGLSTFTGAADFNGSIDVDGHTELDDVNVSGAITATTFTGNLAGTVNTAAQPNITSLGTLSALTVSGDITANGNIVGDNSTNITGIASVTATTLSGTLQTAAQPNITSVGTLTGLDVNGHTELDDVNVSGVSTFTELKVGTAITMSAGIITATSFTGAGGNPSLRMTGGKVNFVDGVSNFGYVEHSGTGDLEIGASNGIVLASDGSGVLYVNVNGNVGIGTTTPSQKLDVNGHTELDDVNVSGVSTFTGAADFNGSIDVDGHTELDDVNVSGAITATTFTGNLTGNADTATSLATARTFELTGDVVASQISFDGTGNVSLAATIQPNSVALGGDTTGDYVESISGTGNQITVTSGTGEGSTPVISIPNNPTLPGTTVTVATDLQVNRNLNVTGNVTIGGTSATLFTETLKISDPDIIVGFRTDANNNDISNDTTASHGGIAVASTEGSPLVSFVGGGGTIPATYKKIFWFESGAFTGLATDAWLTNYAFGVGTTSMSAGTKFAVGNIETDFDDITSVVNINSSGVVTATTFSGSGASLTDIPNGALTNSSIAIGGVTLNLGDTDATPAFDLSDATAYPFTSLTGITTEILGDTTPQLGGNLDLNSKFITGTGGINVTGVVTATTFSGSGASLTDIPNGALTNSSIAIGGVTLNLGDTDATPAFDLSDATDYPYTSLTGITTEILGDTTPQLGGNLDLNSKFITGTGGINVTGVVTATTFSGSGANLTSIPNSALVNDSVSFGGVTLNLGDTDATPAFDLSDATDYPYTSLTGITTEIVGDTTPQLGGNLDLNSKFITGTGGINVTGVVTATTFSGSGANLTDITASQVSGSLTGVTIREEGSIVGTASSISDINFASSNLTASASGIGATITLTDTPTFTSTVIGSGVTVNSSGINVTGVVTATTFSGSGANLTSVPNGALDNSTVSYGGVELSLGGSDATPAFNLSDATAYPYTSLTGITTSIVGDTTPQLGGNLDLNSKFITGTGGINVSGVVTATTFSGSGANLTSIPNSALTNDSVSFGGVSLDLGQTDATPAFNLSDATDYPYTSLTGITTEILGDTTPQLGGNLDLNSKFITGTGGINVSGIITATTFSGSGANLTSIPNSALVNDSVSFGGVSVDLGASDATPAFDLSDATNYPTSSLTGTITNAQLAGSIANSKLVNDSVSFGGVSVDLGASDATPAFDLSDATNYPTSSLTGTITNAQLAGSIANSKLANDSVSFGGISVDLGASDATPAFDLSDATNYPYTSLTGITTSILGDTTPQLGGNLDLNSKFITGTGGINVTGIVTATSLDAAISEWVLGANGTSDYTFTGPGLTGAENDPSIYLVRGQKYNFKNSSGGHPFRIQSTPNGSAGTQYNDGITNNDAGNGVTLNWDVQFDAPEILYYQCTSHAAMGGKIYIGNSGESIIVGAAVTINSSGINATGVVTATSFAGDGSALTGIAAGGSGEFNTGITSSRQIVPLSFETSVFTFPSTAGRQYVIESINVANVDASVGLGTTVNIIASIQDATAAEQTYIAYNVPIVTGGLIELLKNPIVAGPSDVIKMWSTNDGYAGVSNAAEVYMSYSEFESTDYISKFASTTTINSTDTITLYTSTSNPTAIEKIGFANRTDIGDFPISIKITNGTTTSYLAKDLIIPRYSTVDILDRPKRIETGAKIEVEVGSTSTVDVIISGKKITS